MDLLQAFDERRGELEAYLDFLDALERTVQKGPPALGATRIRAEQQRILYSNVYLLLYNLVEASITWCLDELCRAAVNQGRWRASDLTEAVRREWIRVMARTNAELSSDHRLTNAFKLSDLLIRELPLTDWKIERGGGNWDDYQIERIVKQLGLSLSLSPEVRSNVKRPFRDDKGVLVLVRDLRNRLAHGTISFAECGESVTSVELRDLCRRASDYLREVVSAFATAIREYQFLAPDRRPSVH